MEIIDCRYRPPTAGWMQSIVTNPVYAEYVRETGFAHKPVRTREACVAELDALGVVHAVIAGRDIASTWQTPSTNPLMDDDVRACSGKFLGAYGVDPWKGMAAYAALRQALENGRCVAASIEPGMARCAVDDARYYPFYALCCDRDAPVLVTAGLAPHMPGVLLESTAPCRLDKVASDFPDLRLLISHGGYPFVGETLGVCLRHRNVFLDFSSTHGKPLAGVYVEAARTTLAGGVVFSSASPFVELSTALQQVLDMALPPAIQQGILRENARRLFRNAFA